MNISKVTPNLHYCGKLLKQGNKYYSGKVLKILKSGKGLSLDYKNGLLQKAMVSNGETVTKSYDYDKDKRLINVKENGKDVFVKDIENKIGINFRRVETINNSIHRVYDGDNHLILSRILPKSLLCDFASFYSPKQKSDIVREDRYFISNLVCDDGHYYLKPKPGSSAEPDFVWFRSIYRILKEKFVCIMEKDNNKINTTLKDYNGDVLLKSSELLDENNMPVYTHISGKDDLSIDLKYFLSSEKSTQRIIAIKDSKTSKSALESEYDSNRNIIRERNFEYDKKGNVKQVNIIERKFDENNLMTEEKKFKEGQKGKKLVYTVKKEYNSRKLPVSEEYYNAKDELESSEYYVYDKRGKLRVSVFHEYGEFPESGYSVYDRNGILRKKASLEDGVITEEHYDKNALYIKKIKKFEDGTIDSKYDYIYDADKKNKIKTINTDGEGHVLLTADFLKDSVSGKETIIYRGPEGELLCKEFIKHDDNGYKHYYTDSEGKRCSFITKIILVHDVNL